MRHFAIILLLIILIAIGAVPSYLKAKWAWTDLPQVQQINQIRNLRETGLEIPGWQTILQKEITIGDKQWSGQILQKPGAKKVTLLLMPQNYYRNQPSVEWMDINGVERWQTDSYSKLKFKANTEQKSVVVTARFFRAWNQRQTFAVVQWYAIPQGGTASNAQWFWRDLMAQLHRTRVPWIAVCLKIEMEPLGDLAKTKNLAMSLAKIVQTRLMQTAFAYSQE